MCLVVRASQFGGCASVRVFFLRSVIVFIDSVVAAEKCRSIGLKTSHVSRHDRSTCPNRFGSVCHFLSHRLQTSRTSTLWKYLQRGALSDRFLFWRSRCTLPDQTDHEILFQPSDAKQLYGQQKKNKTKQTRLFRA